MINEHGRRHENADGPRDDALSAPVAPGAAVLLLLRPIQMNESVTVSPLGSR